MEPATNTLINESEQYVRSLFNSKQAKNLIYHNLNHTKEVVQHCEHMADIYGVEGEDEVILLVAAWFHDTGYLKGPAKGHEEESKKIAREFLDELGTEGTFIDRVEQCIDATKFPQQPKNTIEEIICDADLYHVGTEDFYERSLLLRDELNHGKKNDTIGKKEWRLSNINFLKAHHFFTMHAKEFLDPVKQKNLEQLEVKAGLRADNSPENMEAPVKKELPEKEKNKKQSKEKEGDEKERNAKEKKEEIEKEVREGKEEKENIITDDAMKENSTNENAGLFAKDDEILEAEDIRRVMEEERLKNPVPPLVPEVPVEKKKKKKKDDALSLQQAKEKKTERGVVAMFRIMSENHVNLSQMADSKANIMISINTIVVSILVSVLLGKLQFYPQYIIPTIMLMTVCLGAIVFAILATRPNITEGKFTEQDIRDKKINLLFFGNFYNMDLESYDWAMKEMMQDKEYLYGSMIKDIYFLGVVLARKYKLLRISYNIFMFGIVASIVGFGIAMFISG
jgi:predicted metal-dependent HD superfamily phosphohydrolase